MENTLNISEPRDPMLNERTCSIQWLVYSSCSLGAGEWELFIEFMHHETRGNHNGQWTLLVDTSSGNILKQHLALQAHPWNVQQWRSPSLQVHGIAKEWQQFEAAWEGGEIGEGWRLPLWTGIECKCFCQAVPSTITQYHQYLHRLFVFTYLHLRSEGP